MRLNLPEYAVKDPPEEKKPDGDAPKKDSSKKKDDSKNTPSSSDTSNDNKDKIDSKKDAEKKAPKAPKSKDIKDDSKKEEILKEKEVGNGENSGPPSETQKDISSIVDKPGASGGKSSLVKKSLITLLVIGFLAVGYFSYVDFFGKPDLVDIFRVTPDDDEVSVSGFVLPFDKSKFDEGVNVGSVTIYYTDLEKKFSLFFPSTEEAKTSLANWREVLEMVNEDAILQNEGIKVGLYDAESSNTVDPRKVTKARTHFNTKGKEYVSGEFISVWFYNTRPPAIGVDAAKEETRPIISDLRQRVVSGEITMEEAGNTIINNTSLAEIDSAYESNAYRNFNYISREEPIFTDDRLNRALWDMEEGEVSSILTGHDYGADGEYQAYFIVLQVNEKVTENNFRSADQIVRKRMSEGYRLEL